MWILIAVIIIGIAVMTVFFYESLEDQLFRERQSHLQEMTVKISEVLDVTIGSMQEKSDTARDFLAATDITADNATTVMENIADYMNVTDGVLYAIDDDSHYYSSAGVSGRWSKTEDLVSTDNKPQIRELIVGDNQKTCMVFFAQLEEAKPLGGSEGSVSLVALALPLESIGDYLSISTLGDESYTYLVNQEGSRLYKQTYSNTFIEDYNVLRALVEEKFIRGGTVEELSEAVSNEENFCAEFVEKNSDINYFVSTVPVADSDWTVFLFVPTSVLGVQSGGFMSILFAYFIALAVAGILIFTCLMYMAITNRDDKRLLAQQERNNIKLEKAAEEARNASAAKSEFLAHMSHDIRTPINGIIGMTNIAIKSRGDSERIDDCLHKISGSADHLLSLVNDVLDMSSIESGKVKITNEPLDLRVLINNCASIISGQLLSRDLEFIKPENELPHPFVLGDELHLRQIFINILGNAVKFTPNGGRIEFRATETGTTEHAVSYRFEFADTGIGISDEFKSKIFEAFSQEQSGGRTHYQGTGLGMAITKEFVDLMGGTISVESELGKGTCFTVELTFDIDKDAKEEVKEEAAELNLKGMKVLLVEDNELNMEIAEEIMHDEGIITTEATDGKQAVDVFAQSKPGDFDAILMDIMMPVMNGYEATKAIRAMDHPSAKTVPIIAMTANAYREDVEHALEAGMNAHVAKPIDIGLLLSVLDECIKKGKAL
jgi:signal transduction histidine kinase